MKLVSIYLNKFHSGTDVLNQKPPDNLDLDLILDSIKSGLYESRYPLKDIRLAKSNLRIEEERVSSFTKDQIQDDEKFQKAYKIVCDLKDKVPRFTVAGVFKPEGRKADNILAHSEFIDIDIDKLDETDIEQIKQKFIHDKYTYAIFKSCGGDGLCVIFRIEPSKHEDAYEGIKEYIFHNYGIHLDKAHKNVANTRNFSYDPDLYCLGHYPPVFKEYIKKKKEKQLPLNNFVYAKNDFESCIKQIVGQQLDFCPDYISYRDIGFAIANKFGLLGLDYFDAVCQFGAKYNQAKLIKHYKYFCRNPEGRVKIATFFFRCKELNLEIYSKETKLIASVASAAYKSGRTKEDVIKNLEIHEGFKASITEDIVNQVFDEKIDFSFSSGILDDIQSYIKFNYSLKLNEVTGKFEDNGVEWDEFDFNSCLVEIKKVYEKADAKWTERILFSKFIPRYNPVTDFFEENKHLAPEIKLLDGKPVIPDIICKLWDSVQTRSAYYTQKFGTKWLVGAVSTWLKDEPSNLELIFAGVLEKGKTHFIRYLLPEKLMRYYAEARVDGSNDSNVMMCQKLLINQNECGGRNKNDDEVHKDTLDKKYFTLRRPYRRDNEDMRRIAAPFGTTNGISDVITDRLGNRRIIVTEVINRDRDAYDNIDKTELWMAVYALYKAGFNWKILGDEIKELNHYSSSFEAHEIEYELIAKYFEHCEEGDSLNVRYTASEIKVYIETRTQQKLRYKLMIQELSRMNFEIVDIVVGAIKKKVYNAKINTSLPVEEIKPPLPF